MSQLSAIAQARRLREEGEKVAALQTSLARVLADFQADRVALTSAFAAERSEAQADLRALRQLAKARGRALHKARCPCTHPSSSAVQSSYVKLRDRPLAGTGHQPEALWGICRSGTWLRQCWRSALRWRCSLSPPWI